MSKMNLKTPEMVAKKCGCSVQYIRRMAVKLATTSAIGNKFFNRWLFSPREAALIAAMIRRPGRPRE